MIMPAPNPWMPRKMMSSVMLWDMPARADPSTRMAMPMRKNGLRPNRSVSRPTTATVVVEVTMKAVNTQAMCCRPCRSATTRGRAVPTIVWSMAAVKIPSRLPTITSTRVRVPIREMECTCWVTARAPPWEAAAPFSTASAAWVRSWRASRRRSSFSRGSWRRISVR